MTGPTIQIVTAEPLTGSVCVSADAKVPYVKVTRPDSHGEGYGCWWPLAAFSAADEFDGAEEGERIVLELCSFTQAEIDAMPEFEGW